VQVADNYDQYSKEELLRLLRERDRKPKFGLVWERNEIEHDKSLNDDFVALDLDPVLSCGDAPFENLIIEGDNFDALRYLRMTHAGRVKCIYIDPPYNTGNRDFIYNDRFVDPEDSYRHSKWLEFLYRRLVLAKDLLREDGVMLVSINDENRAKLELLLDQVLPGMRVGSFTWRSRLGDNRPKGAYLSVNHEHVLVYANSGFRFRGSDKTFDMYSNPDKDPHGAWRPDNLTGPASWKERPNTFYPIQDPASKIWYPCNPDRVWVYATEDRVDDPSVLRKGTMESYIRAGRVIFPRGKRVAIWQTRKELDDAIRNGEVPKDGNGNPLLRQDLPDDVLTFFIGKSVGWGIPAYKRYQADAKETVQPISSWIKSTADKETENSNEMTTGLTDEGSKLLRQQIGTKIFQFPKPPSLMKELVLQSSADDDIVLDFFAGSGTTAYAVALANAVDGGSRRYVP
jgi:adenine-specific DNA-methyltransferase